MNKIEAFSWLLAGEDEPKIKQNEQYLIAQQWLASHPEHQASYESERALYAEGEGLLSGFLMSDIAKEKIEQQLQECIKKERKKGVLAYPEYLKGIAAVGLLCIGVLVGSLVQMNRQEPVNIHSAEQSLAGFSDSMVQYVDSAISLGLKGQDQEKLQQWLKLHNAPPAYDGVCCKKGMHPVGCQIVYWNGEPVSLVCFKDKKTGRMMHVFSVNAQGWDTDAIADKRWGYDLYSFKQNGKHVLFVGKELPKPEGLEAR